jgi:hypothetical protein
MPGIRGTGMRHRPCSANCGLSGSQKPMRSLFRGRRRPWNSTRSSSMSVQTSCAIGVVPATRISAQLRLLSAAVLVVVRNLRSPEGPQSIVAPPVAVQDHDNRNRAMLRNAILRELRVSMRLRTGRKLRSVQRVDFAGADAEDEVPREWCGTVLDLFVLSASGDFCCGRPARKSISAFWPRRKKVE